MSFCRITGKARSLPKPNFFPIIPPISPADAQKLCRITSKRADEHKFVPLFEAGKRPVSLRCPVTGKNLGGKNNKIASDKSNNNNKIVNNIDEVAENNVSNNKSGLHSPQNDFKYVSPLLKRDSMEKGDLRAFEDLMKVLKEIKNEMTAEGEDTNKKYVYAMPSMQCGLVVPAEIEEAIRRGELESVSLSQSCDRAIFKVKGKRTLFVPLKEVDYNQNTGDKLKNKGSTDNLNDALNGLYEGKGQSKETLNRQRQEIENRKKKNSANKKMFEDLEKKAENERQKDLERTQQGNKQKVPGGRRSKEAQQYRQKVEKFKAKFLSENNMKEYGEFKKALKTNLHVIDWEKIGRLKGDEIKPLQMPGKRRKLQHEDVFQDPEVAKQLNGKKRIKNVYIPDHSGLEMVPVVEEFAIDPCHIPRELLEFIHKSKSESTGYTSSLKSMFACQESLKILPNLNEFEAIGKTLNASGGQKLRMGCMYDRGDGAKFTQDISQVPAGANIIMGAVVMVSSGSEEDEDGVPKFVPGEIVKMSGGKEIFVPGQRMNSANGEFVPGASIRSESGFFQFIPGVVTGGDGKKVKEHDSFGSGQFRAGQFVASGEGVESIKFVKGEVVHTTAGTKFVEGETISTADGLKFVAGVSVDTKDGPVFLPGALVETGENDAKFVSGFLMGGTDSEDLTFISGRTAGRGSASVFVPGQVVEGEFVEGQMIDVSNNNKSSSNNNSSNNKASNFLPGAIVTDQATGESSFIPGLFEKSSSGGEDKFIAGVIIDTMDGPLFIEGRLVKDGEKDTIFAPGHTNEDGSFHPAAGPTGMSMRRTPEPGDCVDGANLAISINKKTKPKNGRMVKPKDGSGPGRFYADGDEIPPEVLEVSEMIPGRMEWGENGPAFVPGTSMELNGIRSFIPGKVVRNADGSQSFVPGKVINTKNGPKFVCGQVIQTEEGEKFLPGIVMEKEGQGKVFVPAMEMQTKTGPMLIPGQVIRTDNGLKFVPGDMVSTENGALFVPALVMDSPDGAKLLHGEVIQTPEGPRLLPPDVKGDGNLELCVQGFDINLEEARLLMGKNMSSSDVVSDLLGGVGGAVVSPEALKALAEGFDTVNSENLIPTVGADLKDADQVLEDELLEAYDSPKARRTVKRAFIKVMAELCDNTKGVDGAKDKFILETLTDLLHETLIEGKDKLNPALEKLKALFEEKKPGTSEENDLMNLLAGMITCSIPGALKECANDHKGLSEAELYKALLGCVDDSVKGILIEDGMVPKGLAENMEELMALVKDMEENEGNSNKSLFAKVAEVSERRCNNKAMEELLEKVSTGQTLEEMGGEAKVKEKLVAMMANKVDLKEAFKEMSEKQPGFVEMVLNNLESESKDNANMNAADLLHNAVVRTVEDGCQRQLNRLIAQLEESGGKGALTDDDVKSMLKQAIGLARFMGREHVVEALTDILNDPGTVSAIRDDAVTRGILRKILVMRRLACRDSAKKKKLDKLEKYSSRKYHEEDDSSDSSLRRFIDQSEALTRGPVGSRLKKSKSMVKKSKSMIMTAKDIPMNAFLAMKNTADEKDERWLQNFLSESVIEDVPWECSKALIILKEGFQAIIPREASRSILLGEASYTLIDDNGIEFYLSPADKKRREMREQDEELRPNHPEIGDKKTNEEEEASVRSEMTNASSDKKSLRDVLEADPLYQSAVQARKEEDKRERLKDPMREDFSFEGKRRKKGAGDLNEEEEKTPRKRPPAKKFDWEVEQKEGDTMDSLEKYRPHNYDFGSRRKGEPGRQSHKLQSSASVDHSDINDLRDYYSGIGTHQRALRRLNLLQGGHSGDQQDPMGDFEPHGGGGGYAPRKVSFGGYSHRYGDDVEEEEEARPSRRKSTTAAYGGGGGFGHDRDRFAHSKNFWLDEVDNARKRSGMPTKKEQIQMEEEEERGPQRTYDWENDTFVEDKPKQSEALTTTGRARNILDQVKESTMALQNLNEQAEEDAYDRMGYGQQRPRQQRQRRQQQRQPEPEMGGYGGYGRSMSMDEQSPYYEDPPYRRQQQRPERVQYASLADEVLADRGGGAYRRKPIQADDPYNSHQNEDNYGGGYSSSYSRRQPSPPSTTGWRDTEDVDAMIADLKKKTTGRDMRDVLRNIEASDRRGGGGDYYPTPSTSDGWGRGGSSRPDSDYSLGANRQGGGGFGGQTEHYYGGGGGGEERNGGGRGGSFPPRQSPPPPNLKTRFSARGPFDEEENEVGGGGGRFRRQRTSEGDLERRGGGGRVFSSGRGGSRFSRDELDARDDDVNDMMPKRRFGRRNVSKFDDEEEPNAPFGRTNRGGGGRRRIGGDDGDEDFAPSLASKGRSSVGRDFGGGGGGGVGRRAKQQRNRSVLEDDDD